MKNKYKEIIRIFLNNILINKYYDSSNIFQTIKISLILFSHYVNYKMS